ncbi:MAG: restriction endonuclease subunit S [Candidatus Thiodiazotropha sp. (ex Troendleina suluensis)]|nr:restriction endonuclease subunit S [Candidatus Thiodiazotropha sp. (ex Troendleina suluensis)]
MSNSQAFWEEKTIGDIVSVKRGYDLTSQQRKSGNVPVYGAAGQNGYHNESKAEAPGIVIGRSGGSFGKVNFVKQKYWPHNTAMYVTDFKGNDPKFTYYLLKLLDFSALNSGSAQPSLNRNYLYPVRIRVPDPEEQARVGRLLGRLDEKIELNNKINAELEAMAKLIYDYWFVQFDFPDANGKPYKSSGGKMVYNETLKREIPDGWIDGNVLEVSDLLGGGTPTKKNPDFWGGEIPFFTPTDSNGNVFSFTTDDYITQAGLKGSSTKLFEKNTVFITARGSVGRLVLNAVPMAMNQSCYAFKAKPKYSYSYLFFLIKELIHHLEVKATGSVFNSIVSNDIEWTNLALPKADETVQKYAEIVEPLFERIYQSTKEILELEKLRDWLLPMLMNGQVTVKDAQKSQ